MDWWRDRQENQPLKNPLGLPDKLLDLLAEDMNRYGAGSPALPGRLMSYLVDGEDEGALQDLSTAQPLDYGSSLRCTQFLEEQWIDDPQFYRRLIEVYDAEPIHYKPSITGNRDLMDKVAYFITLIKERRGKNFQAQLFDQILNDAGYDSGTFVRLVHDSDGREWRTSTFIKQSYQLRGFKDLCLDHTDVIVSILESSPAAHKVNSLTILETLAIPLDSLITALISLVGSSSKTVRESVAKLLKQNPDLAVPRLQEVVKTGKTDARYQAIQLLWDLEGEQVREFLETWQQQEKLPKVKALIEQLLTSSRDSTQYEGELALPPLPAIELDAPISAALRSELKLFTDQCNQVVEQKKEILIKMVIRERNNLSARHRYPQSYWLSELFSCGGIFDFTSKHPEYTDEQMEQGIRERFESRQKKIDLEKLEEWIRGEAKNNLVNIYQWVNQAQVPELHQCLLQLLGHPDLGLAHMVRLMLIVGQFSTSINDPVQQADFLHYLTCHSLGLRELHAAIQALEVKCNDFGKSLFWSGNAQDNVYTTLSKDAIWPYYAEDLSRIERGMDSHYRKETLRLLTCFPSPPPSLIPKLWEIALGSAKQDRPLAQTCLDPLPDTENRLRVTLKDSRWEIRALAAEWLTNRGSETAIEPIRAALKQEKSDGAKDTMLRCLERLGASVDEFLDRDNLLKEAQQDLKKGIPTPLADWFPFTSLPTVNWSDTQEAVDPQILTWFIVQIYKQKSPEPGPILKRYTSQFDPRQRQALGQFILSAWITQDTLPLLSPQQAEERARQEADREQARCQKYIPNLQQQIASLQSQNTDPSLLNYLQQELQNLQSFSWERYYKGQLNTHLSICKGSATKEKGILALAAACCGPEAVPVIERYIKRWYGGRASQCKSLINVLAWIEDNTAIQLLLAIANRFRTKSIQKEAELQVNQLAERHNWTRDELSDRTIPTAGFESNGIMLLDYGERQFQASLDPKFNVIITDWNGKQMKSLPEARKDEDADHIKALKKHLSDGKKQIKQVLKIQTERLYEAMCTQRSWIFEDWDQFLYHHPIVGALCQRLIWGEIDEDQVIQTFRPLEDGTLTDMKDQQVTVATNGRIQLAHTAILSADLVQAWREHLSDYEIEPVFEQFPVEIYSHESKSTETEIKTYEGYILEAFQLRGVLTKRGYTRDTTEDGGYFYGYLKKFSGLGLEAVIEFSGNYLPEDNNRVALISLSFRPLSVEAKANYYYENKIPLKRIPKVLLSEVWNDMKTAALQGAGYDPDWERKLW